jgi:hypothetical protein
LYHARSKLYTAITKCGGKTPRCVNDILISSDLMMLGILNGFVENILV